MKVFQITFTCENCGNEWTEKFDKGDKVDGTYLNSHKCDHTHACKYCRRIKCPVCDEGSSVFPRIHAKERKPIKEAINDKRKL